MRHAFMLLLLVQLGFSVQAKFHDEGFIEAKIRTDFSNPYAGTIEQPITLGRCLYDFPEVTITYACDGPMVYSQSNFYAEHGGDTSDNYWVLHVNNESSFAQFEGTPYNSGPPGQSLAVVEPASEGIMGFASFKECDQCSQSSNIAQCNATCEDFYRAHIVLSHNELNPNPIQAIPFLGINAVNQRGNNEPIVKINAGFGVENSISFDIKLYDYKAPENNSSAAFIYLYFTSQWENPLTHEMINRMLFVTLGHTPTVDVIPNNTIIPKPPSDNFSINQAGVNLSWNWPIVESFFYPGADFAYMESEDIHTYCGFELDGFDMPYRNQGFNPNGSDAIEKSFTINIEALFKCASDHQLFDAPMPNNEVLDVNIVGWANEIGGGVDSHIWMAVSNMRTLYGFKPKTFLKYNTMNCPYCIYTTKASTQKTEKNEKRVKLNFDFYNDIYRKLGSESTNAKGKKNEKNKN
jgi:hypothetical protein